MSAPDDGKVRAALKRLSDRLDLSSPFLGIVLAAGHGRRIRSETSKMLHAIWGVPTVERVRRAVARGLGTDNVIIVTGVKAEEVASAVGRSRHAVYAYQPEQKGTGHAVQCALRALAGRSYKGSILVAPGDAGLLTGRILRRLRRAFEKSGADMTVLTAMYEGDPETNYYGRIVRAPADSADAGKILGIVEFKDIRKMRAGARWTFHYNGRRYDFTRPRLLETREFNAGVYLYKAKLLRRYVNRLRADNVQGEVYLTDLIKEFVTAGLPVTAHVAEDPDASLGFNDKTVLRRMEAIARARVYERLRNIVTFGEPTNFFIADEVVEQILRMDRRGKPLDIVIGEGARVHAGVRLNYGVTVGNYAVLDGNILLGRNVEIGPHARLSTYPRQKIVVGDDSVIMENNHVKGAVTLGKAVRIEGGVNITGSDAWPTTIGDRVVIKGTSYLFGAHVQPDVPILHSVLMRKRIERVVRSDGTVQPVRYFLPMVEGADSVRPLNDEE